MTELFTAEKITFFVFAIPLVATAIGVVVARSPMYAAMSLVAAFFFMAGIYVLLSAHLIAFLQILVYAGAVMVLFLFVIMLLSLGDHQEVERLKQFQWLGFVLGGGGLMALLAWISREVANAEMATLSPDFGTIKAVGRALFTTYLLPFEATSLLLTVAIVGAVVVAKEKI